MADDKPTFHHMNAELEIPYSLVNHLRNPMNDPQRPFLSPPSLQATGPYGKAPTLFTSKKDGERYIPESSAIATYLIRTFDTEDKFGLKNGDWIRDEMLMSLAQTNLQRAGMVMLMLDFNILRNGEVEKLGERAKRCDGPELRMMLGQVERELKEGPEGGWFMGKQPGRADIMMEFPLSMIKHRNWVDLKTEFPALDAWLERVYNRDGWRRGIEKGNGYDLSVFPQRPHL
ncbi:related to glutathione S-transferase III [Phialocephala subalpina]|uniref:Related to glutathione S-transferase III n=1 Tax=Phialocephala subalpina TaxID=576137 RepID=A0A1L7WYI2_9HELO|nr:related to glutathione S-transferase III [Phialocephala subalpina]